MPGTDRLIGFRRARMLAMSEAETTFLLRQYFHGGGSAIPVIRKLMQEGELDQAAVVARLAVRLAEGKERDEIFALLGEITSAPTGWSAALERFAAEPSEETWDELMRFVPEDVLHQRLKYTILLLLGTGCDGDVLFRCVSRFGMLPELYDVAESGRVGPDTIVARATGSPAEAAWLGLAAIAALARGDRDATVRHLWRASQLDPILSIASIVEIRERADADLNAQLDQAGVPRGFEGRQR
jgi:hypothetical protein